MVTRIPQSFPCISWFASCSCVLFKQTVGNGLCIIVSNPLRDEVVAPLRHAVQIRIRASVVKPGWSRQIMPRNNPSAGCSYAEANFIALQSQKKFVASSGGCDINDVAGGGIEPTSSRWEPRSMRLRVQLHHPVNIKFRRKSRCITVGLDEAALQRCAFDPPCSQDSRN